MNKLIDERKFSVTFKNLKLGEEISIEELDYSGSEKSFQSIMIFLMSFDPVNSFISDDEEKEQFENLEKDLGGINNKEEFEDYISEMQNGRFDRNKSNSKVKSMSGAVSLNEQSNPDPDPDPDLSPYTTPNTEPDLDQRPSLGKRR